MRRNELKTDGPFRFEAGGGLDSVTLSYYTSDREYVKGEKVVWVCHALTGNANPEDWWPGMAGRGKFLDPDRYFIVCVSMLASPYGSCSPATPDPATGKPYLLDFPRVTIRDMVRANIIVRKHLGIECVDYIIGPSIGGFLVSEWLVTEPGIFRKAVLLATAVRVPPYLTAFNESMRMAMLADPTFVEAKDINGGEAGLECARSIALISYRTNTGYNSTQEEPDGDAVFADRAASYQRYQGKKLVDRGFDAYSYWYLSYALDSMNIGRGRGGTARALASIKAECTVICVESDQLFPPVTGRKTASLIPGAKYYEVASAFGHDGFLLENDSLVAILRKVFGSDDL